MAEQHSFCRCGRRVDYGFCDSCQEKWDSERDRIREYVERHDLTYSDEQELIDKASDKFGKGYSIIYCTYRGSCGNVIEDGGEFCPPCTERQKQYERDEETRRRRAVEEY